MVVCWAFFDLIHRCLTVIDLFRPSNVLELEQDNRAAACNEGVKSLPVLASYSKYSLAPSVPVAVEVPVPFDQIQAMR